ncbi:MAG TPA: hypothetical protein VHR86_10640, partial [Armatimonadota bacterium]|nr:hypothetical protein [Armatimonadota bacterium]
MRPISTRTPQYPLPGLQLNTWRLLLFLCAHAPLAVLMHLSSGVVTMHAGITLAVGFWWAFTERRLERIALAGAYITGAEVLWRMTGAHIPWEAGKYAVAAIFLIAILRFRGRTSSLPLLYFALLLPSVPLTLMNPDLSLEEARQQLSFNLSGPFA